MASNNNSKRGLASADEATRKRVASLGGQARHESNNKSESSNQSTRGGSANDNQRSNRGGNRGIMDDNE